MSLLIINSLLLSPFLQIVNSFQAKWIMILGLLVIAISYFTLFKVSNSMPFFLPILFATAVLNSIGSNFYFTLSDTIYYSIIGNSLTPASFSGLFSAIIAISGLASAVIGLELNRVGMQNTLFAVASVGVIIAIIPLITIAIPKAQYQVSFSSYLSRLSFWEHIVSMELSHELMYTATPLVLLLAFNSTGKSFLISGIILISTIFFSYITGYLKDRGNNTILYIAALLSIASWAAYAFIGENLKAFILLGITTAIACQIIGTAFDARIGRRFINSGAAFEANLAFNFSKIFGRITVIVILLTTYVVTNNLDKVILVLGVLFILPKVFYGISDIENLTSVKVVNM